MTSLILIALSLLSQRPFEIPKTSTWQLYEPSIRVDLDTLKYTEFALDSPEGVVASFYASRIRGDDKWQEALLPVTKRSKNEASDLTYKLDKMSRWKLRGVHLVGRQDKSPTQVGIKILFIFDEKVGFDEGEVRLIDGRWYFTTPPT